MRKSIWNYAKLVCNTLPIRGPVYEFGSYQVEGGGEGADLRPLFQGMDYIGCDMREGPGVDQVLDLHDINLPDQSAGTVFMMDTLEHVEYPHNAIMEVYRILKPDGLLVMSSVLDFFIHAAPNDFWRFTPDGFRSLLKPFHEFHVGYYGRDVFPHTLVGIGFKGAVPDLAAYFAAYHEWSRRQTKRVKEISIKLMRDALREESEK